MTLSDNTSLDFKLDFKSLQIVIIQKSELGVELGKITVPMADVKSWGDKFKGLTSFLSLDSKK